MRDFGQVVGSAEADEHRRRAQRNIPQLHQHDRFGHRVDQIEYDPSMHWMLRLGVEREVNSLAWRDPQPGAHVVRYGLFYMMNQLDTGPCCPMSINYAATPTIRQDAALAAEWEQRLTLPDYDRFAQAGMVMTEKQGGSDLRANTTVAEPAGDGWYELTGHKWFCTHPVFEVFLTLGQAPGGITCFVAERPHPGFRLQRLKDKLGGRCLASSEVEFDHLPARILGEEGRGTAFMIEQIVWTRIDTMVGVAGMMRRLLNEAVWHTRRRSAFGATLASQPAMVNVLADLALEAEAAAAASFRVVRAFDEGDRTFGRMALAVMKYWICKRGAPFAAEALECLGGNGYIETQQAPVAQFYRDIQIGTVWEGSGQRDRARRAARDGAGARERRRVHGGVRVGARGGPAPRRASRRDARRARRPRAAPSRSSPPARWSRTWRSRCRDRCWCATGPQRWPMLSAPRGWVGVTGPSARCRPAWTLRRSWTARSRPNSPGARSAARSARRASASAAVRARRRGTAVSARAPNRTTDSHAARPSPSSAVA